MSVSPRAMDMVRGRPNAWNAMVAPKGLPGNVKAELIDALNRALAVNIIAGYGCRPTLASTERSIDSAVAGKIV
jgi:hypothetical protein